MPSRKPAPPAELPEGFLYQPDFLSESEEADVLRTVKTLEFGAYDFRGYIAKRRVVAYGGGYDSGPRRMSIADKAIPEFLTSIRERAACVAGLRPEEIAQGMVTEYPPGAPIGWHRDSPQFETIIGVSLESSCRMRLKPYKAKGKIVSVILEPRSIYVISGAARWNFQHSIPPMEQLRYSITFRTLSKKSLSKKYLVKEIEAEH
ncbi:MAG: alpha-ketoglutarate-dependent dioxygenase AlkB [Candidatus Sulfotelmatobacter sp.]